MKWCACTRSSSAEGRRGRAPSFAGPDLVIATLEETFTPAEQRLADMGEHQRLRDTRLYFQYATDDEFRSVIERILGRKVRAFNSAIDTRVDVCVEVFHLEARQAEEVAQGEGI